MKTLRALKITSILQIIFCVFCIASTVCFAISHYQCIAGDNWRIAFNIANVLIYGWIANPVAPISFIVCIIFFLIERKQPNNRKLIGRKWIWIFIWPVITTFFYFVSICLLVEITGGV